MHPIPRRDGARHHRVIATVTDNRAAVLDTKIEPIDWRAAENRVVATPAIRLDPTHRGEATAQQADLFGRCRGRQPFVTADCQQIV